MSDAATQEWVIETLRRALEANAFGYGRTSRERAKAALATLPAQPEAQQADGWPVEPRYTAEPHEYVGMTESRAEWIAHARATRAYAERRIGRLVFECDGLREDVAMHQQRRNEAYEAVGRLERQLAEAEQRGREAGLAEAEAACSERIEGRMFSIQRAEAEVCRDAIAALRRKQP